MECHGGRLMESMRTAQEEPERVDGRSDERKERPLRSRRVDSLKRAALEQDGEIDVRDKQRRSRQCLEAQLLQFIEFNDKTTEPLSRRRGRPPVIQWLAEERRCPR